MSRAARLGVALAAVAGLVAAASPAQYPMNLDQPPQVNTWSPLSSQAQGQLHWVTSSPVQGKVGERWTVTLALDTPIPAASITGATLVFMTSQARNVEVPARVSAAGDPVRQLTLTAEIPSDAVRGMAASLYLAQREYGGIPIPLSAPAAPGLIVLPPGAPEVVWRSGAPMGGKVGDEVTVKVALEPPIARDEVKAVDLHFTGTGGTLGYSTQDRQVRARDVRTELEGDPVKEITVTGRVPPEASSGPLTVQVMRGKKFFSMVAESPRPFRLEGAPSGVGGAGGAGIGVGGAGTAGTQERPIASPSLEPNVGIGYGRLRGVVVEPMPPDAAMRMGIPPGEGGVRVKSVDPNSPAGARGLQAGDLIFGVEGEPVRSPADFERITRSTRPDEPAQIEAGRPRP